MGEISKALGQGAEIEYKGKTYRMAPWTYKIQGQYELYLERQALASLRRHKNEVMLEEYEEMRAAVVRDISSGVYTFGTRVVQDSLRSIANLKYLFYLQLSENHPEIVQSTIDGIFDEKLDEVYEKMAEANADPNPKTPTTIPQDAPSA